jgi:hypothetical protein
MIMAAAPRNRRQSPPWMSLFILESLSVLMMQDPYWPAAGNGLIGDPPSFITSTAAPNLPRL